MSTALDAAIDAGEDATPMDANPQDAPLLDAASDGNSPVELDPLVCQTASVSDLPGVSLEIDAAECDVSIEELEQGVNFNYRVVVRDPLDRVVSNLMSSDAECVEPGPSGLSVLTEIEFGDLRACGYCAGRCTGEEVESELAPGAFAGFQRWFGESYVAEGAPNNGIPAAAGEATFVVRATGLRRAGEREQPFHVEAQWRFRITP